MHYVLISVIGILCVSFVIANAFFPLYTQREPQFKELNFSSIK